MNNAMSSESAAVLAQGGSPSPDAPVVVLAVILALAFAMYLAALAMTLRRERSTRRDDSD